MLWLLPCIIAESWALDKVFFFFFPLKYIFEIQIYAGFCYSIEILCCFNSFSFERRFFSSQKLFEKEMIFILFEFYYECVLEENEYNASLISVFKVHLG